MTLNQKDSFESDVKKEINYVEWVQPRYITDYFKKYGEGSIELCVDCYRSLCILKNSSKANIKGPEKNNSAIHKFQQTRKSRLF